MRRLIWRGLVAHRARLVVTVVAIALGVGFVSGTFVLTDTLRASIDRVLASAQTATSVVVCPQSAIRTFKESCSLGNHGLTLPASTTARVARVPGVAAATGFAVGPVDVLGPGTKALTHNAGFSLAFSVGPNRSLDPLTLRSGTYPTGPTTAVLDAETAREDRIAIGQSVTVAGSGAAASAAVPAVAHSTATVTAPASAPLLAGALRYRVVGIVGYGSNTTLAGATIVGLRLDQAQAVLGTPGRVSEIAASEQSGITQIQLAKRVRTALGPNDEVQTKTQATGSLRSAVNKGLAVFDDVLLVFAGIALFVAVFLILNTFSILVASRSRELALLRCLGAHRRQLVTAVLAEASAVGAAASVFGVGLGVLLAVGLRALLDAAGVALPQVAPVIEVRTVVVAMVTGIVATVVAALVPAWRGSRAAPVTAMREEPSVDAGKPAPFRRTLGAGLVALGIGIVVATLHAGGGRAGNAGTRAEWAGIGLLIGFLGLAAVIPLVVRPVAAVIGWPFALFGWIPGKLGRRNTMRHPRRTASTAAALMIGLTLMTSIAVLSRSVQASQDASLQRGLLAGFIVTPNGAPSLPRSIVSHLAAERALSDVAALTTAKAKILLPRPIKGLSSKVTVAGAVPARYAKDVSIPLHAGSFAFMNAHTIAITTGIAATWRLHLGSIVPIGSAAVASKNYTVAAIIGDPTGITGDVLCTTAGFVGLFPQDAGSVGQVFANAAPGSSASQADAALRSVLTGYPQAESETKAGFINRDNRQFRQMVGLVTALLGLAVVIALFGIVNTLALSIIERRREIGLLRALGLSRRQLRAAIRVEAVVVAMLGTVLGILLGLGFGWVIVRSLQSDGVDTLEFPIAEIIAFVVASAIAGVFAAAIPARSAARVDVLEAITTE